jgi:hypothetical protein
MEWREVVGFPNYVVSSNGLVKSVRTGCILKQSSIKEYLAVTLYNDGLKKTWPVHKIVAQAFKGPKPEDKEVRHLDGNSHNNAVENIEYGTHAQNMADKVTHGSVSYRGTAHLSAIMDEDKVRRIRQRHLEGESLRSIANSFGCVPSTIYKICARKTWSHVK